MTRKKKNVKAAYIAENIDKIPYITNIAAMTRKRNIKNGFKIKILKRS